MIFIIDNSKIKPNLKISVNYFNKDVKLICLSKTTPLWYFNDMETFIFKGNVLSLTRLKTKDQGFYICHGRDRQLKKFLARVYLTAKCKIDDF